MTKARVGQIANKAYKDTFYLDVSF